MRLDKFLSNLKYGSRNDIKKLIKAKLVTVNGEIVKDSGLNIDENKDIVTIGDETINFKSTITLMVNKPQNYVCSNIDEEYPSLLNLLSDDLRRYDFKYAGRLDYDTEGLVVITTDGDLVHRIITPKKDIYKTYYVKSAKRLVNTDLLCHGIEILDGKNNPFTTSEAFVELISDNEMYLSIKEGKFHQVKRMLEYINNEVVFLKRVKIGNLSLGDLKLGDYKEIDPESIF